MKNFLRSPEFGNTFKFVPNTIEHRNLNGDLRTFQGNRPKWEGFHVTFTALTRLKIDQFKTYVMQTAGDIIQLVDHENRTWEGIISSRQIEIVAGIGECNYQVSFDFEGEVA